MKSVNFYKAIAKVDQINDFMPSIEDAMIAAADPDANRHEMNRLHNLIYILMEQTESLKELMSAVQGDIIVCDAIYAVNDVNKLRAELDELKANA